MVVVDSRVVAYYLLSAKGLAKQAVGFWSQAGRARTRLLAPAVWESEVTAAILGAVRAGVVASAGALDLLRRTERLGIESVPCDSLWEASLSRALRQKTTMRDALFLELACRRRVSLVTFDRSLLERFPRIAREP